jgi:hypothetical protein
VQGVLRNELLDFEINTRCAQSNRPMNMVIGSDLKVKKLDAGSNPYLFVPAVDATNSAEPSIIDIF